MSGGPRSRANILKSLRYDLEAAHGEYMRLSALGNSGDPVENAARREELENLHGIIDGTQYNIAEVEAMPYTAANRLKNQINARRAALKALLDAKSKPGYKSPYAVENMTNEENYSAAPTYAAAPAPAPAPAPVPIMAAFSPPSKSDAPKSLIYSPGLRVDYVLENNTPRTERYRRIMGNMMEERNREMTMAALSPHSRATTAPQYPFAPGRQIYQAEEPPIQNSVGKRLIYPLPGQTYITNYLRKGGRRRSTKYIKRRNRSLPPKHSTRKHRK
jgi:hypothetical protein